MMSYANNTNTALALLLTASITLIACGGDNSKEAEPANNEAENTEQTVPAQQNENNNENAQNNESNLAANEQNEQGGNSNSGNTNGGGLKSNLLFDAALDGSKLTVSLSLKENAAAISETDLAISMRFVDNAGHMLTLTGGDCQTFNITDGLNMTVTFNQEENFTYAAFRSSIFKGAECVDAGGKLIIEHNEYIYKDSDGNMKLIDANEYYANSSANGGAAQ